jgi:hypothetical protein
MSDGKDWLTELQNSDFAKAIRAQCDEQEDADWERSGDGWKGSIGGSCPLQGHGSVGNLFWYFRARHDEWRFEVYPTTCAGALPPDETMVWSAEAEYEGDAPNAGWMKYSEAWALIEECIATGHKVGWSMPGADRPPHDPTGEKK